MNAIMPHVCTSVEKGINNGKDLIDSDGKTIWSRDADMILYTYRFDSNHVIITMWKAEQDLN